MSTKVIKSIISMVLVVLVSCSFAWGNETQAMPMPWDWLDGMMGGGSFKQFKIADLDGGGEEGLPEIVTIYRGFYLVIYENNGTLRTIKNLPVIVPSGTHMGGGSMMASTLEVADFDGDDDLEIMTIYDGGLYYGRYLVVLKSNGDLDGEPILLDPPFYNVNK